MFVTVLSYFRIKTLIAKDISLHQTNKECPALGSECHRECPIEISRGYFLNIFRNLKFLKSASMTLF